MSLELRALSVPMQPSVRMAAFEPDAKELSGWSDLVSRLVGGTELGRLVAGVKLVAALIHDMKFIGQLKREYVLDGPNSVGLFDGWHGGRA